MCSSNRLAVASSSTEPPHFGILFRHTEHIVEYCSHDLWLVIVPHIYIGIYAASKEAKRLCTQQSSEANNEKRNGTELVAIAVI